MKFIPIVYLSMLFVLPSVFAGTPAISQGAKLKQPTMKAVKMAGAYIDKVTLYEGEKILRVDFKAIKAINYPLWMKVVESETPDGNLLSIGSVAYQQVNHGGSQSFFKSYSLSRLPTKPYLRIIVRDRNEDSGKLIYSRQYKLNCRCTFTDQ